MIKSMTGYGRAVSYGNGYGITVELKSVNHKFTEYNIKVSRGYAFIEEKLKLYLKNYISRGKIDCFVQIEAEETQDGVVSLNGSLAAGYYACLQQLCDQYGFEMPKDVSVLASHSDIFNVKKPPEDEDKIWERVRAVADDAVKSLLSMRETEGRRLKDDVLSRTQTILSLVAFIEQRSPETVKIYNDKLKTRIRELIGDVQVDEQRLLAEAAIFADKIAVAEETVRLRSHIDQVHMLLESDEPIGRKLDFIVQEINREANTIGSKASDIEIARKVIDIKSEVEKIREQIQNIE